jgi:prolyl-tRNA editing enzyme YbaK/EbsC (Cys-tRNA(Pro) deacylase)
MSNPMKPASQRVAAAAKGLDVRVTTHTQSARTAEDAAAACRCAVGQIVKSLVFQGATSGTPMLLLVSGANRVNEAGVAAIIGETLKRPDAQFVRGVTGFAIGGIPPLGHDTPLKTYIDKDLLGFPTVWAAAGTPESVFEVDPRALQAATDAVVISMA